MLQYIWFHMKYGCLQMMLFVFLVFSSVCSDVRYKLHLIGRWFVYCCKHKGLYTFKFYEYDTVKPEEIKPEGMTFEEYKQSKRESGDFHSLKTLFDKTDLSLLTTSFVVDDEATYKVGRTYKVPHCWIVNADLKSSIVVIHSALYKDLLDRERQAWLVFMHEFGHIETYEETKVYSYGVREAVADAFSFECIKASWFEVFVYYCRLKNTRDVKVRMFCGIYTYLLTLLNR